MVAQIVVHRYRANERKKVDHVPVLDVSCGCSHVDGEPSGS